MAGCTTYTIDQLQTGLVPTGVTLATLFDNTADMATRRCQMFTFWLKMVNARKYVQEGKCCCPYTILWTTTAPLPTTTTLTCQNMATYYDYVIQVQNQTSGFSALLMGVVLYMRRQSYIQQQYQDGKAVCQFYQTC